MENINNICDDNRERRVFKIDVSDMSEEEIEKYCQKLCNYFN